jgi:hypothetical protein
MPVVTETELSNAQLDTVTLKDVINGSETVNGTGIITSRLGTAIKTLKKVIEDLVKSPVATSAVAKMFSIFQIGDTNVNAQLAQLRTDIDLLLDQSTTFQGYVDFVNGNDSNSGLTYALRKKTVQSMVTALTSGGTIGLQAGQYHPITNSTNFAANTFAKLGSGENAILDIRQFLSTLTWTLESGVVWKTEVTIRNNLPCNGTSDANTYYPGLWVDEILMEHMYEGADIAANIALVQAKPGSYTLHKKTSTIKDIRFESAANVLSGTILVIYVNLPDSSNANGKNIKFNDQTGLNFPTFVNGVTLIGSNGKDSSNVTASAKSLTYKDFGSHACICTSNLSNYKAYGKGTKGMLYADKNMSFSGINCFTTTDQNKDILYENVDIANVQAAIFGHGLGSNFGYNKMVINGYLKCHNSINLLSFTPLISGANSGKDFIKNGVIVNASIYATKIKTAFVDANGWEINGGGYILLDNHGIGGGAGLASVTKPQTTIIKNLAFEATQNNVIFSVSNLIYSTNDSATPGTLILDNCIDLGWSSERRCIIPTGDNAFTRNNIKLVLRNRTILGNLHDWDNRWAQGAGAFPKELTIEAGCQFGFGNRTGPQIEATLTANGTPFTISGQTTVVGMSGQILSAPGWK